MKRQEEVSEADSHMAAMTESLDQEFKTTLIDMTRDLMEKVGDTQNRWVMTTEWQRL